jgi:hypothetical protein
MQLKQLEELGGFLSDVLVEREIRFKLDDAVEHTATIYVKKLGLGEYERLFAARAEKDDKFGTSARIIAEAVSLGEGGKERIPVEKAFRLHKRLANAMLDAFQEVNGGKKD